MMMSSYLICTLPGQGAACRTCAHQEHRVNHDAQAADRTKVPAEVIQVTAHEVDTDSDKAESAMATSGSEGSESASDSE